MTKPIPSLLLLSILLIGCPEAPRQESAESGGDLGAATVGPGLPEAGTLDAGVTGTPDSAVDAGGGARAALTQETLSKFMSCGAYESSLGPAAYSIEDDFDECVARCTVANSCAELKTVLCWDDTRDENGLTRCIERCDQAPQDGFRCGDGTRVAHAFRCDYLEDCADGSDEANCGQFRCMDGEVLPNASARCDYVEDCDDGSDELGCALRCW